MVYFFFYFLFFMLMFTWINQTAQLDPGTDKPFPNSDYPGISKAAALVIMTFRNSIGDLVAPNYTKWLNVDSEAKSTEHLILIIVIWTMWVVQAIIMIVVLLNFLIAVITQTYESVYGKKVIYIFNDKAALNKEYFQI